MGWMDLEWQLCTMEVDVLTGVVHTYIFIQIHVYIQSPMPPECNTIHPSIHPSIHLFSFSPTHTYSYTPPPPFLYKKNGLNTCLAPPGVSLFTNCSANSQLILSHHLSRYFLFPFTP